MSVKGEHKCISADVTTSHVIFVVVIFNLLAYASFIIIYCCYIMNIDIGILTAGICNIFNLSLLKIIKNINDIKLPNTNQSTNRQHIRW